MAIRSSIKKIFFIIVASVVLISSVYAEEIKLSTIIPSSGVGKIYSVVGTGGIYKTTSTWEPMQDMTITANLIPGNVFISFGCGFYASWTSSFVMGRVRILVNGVEVNQTRDFPGDAAGAPVSAANYAPVPINLTWVQNITTAGSYTITVEWSVSSGANGVLWQPGDVSKRVLTVIQGS